MLKVLSVHWGLSIGGVGKYAVLLEQVERFADVRVHSLCIMNKARQIDQTTVNALQHKTILWRKSLMDFAWVGESVELIQSLQPNLIMSHGFNGHFAASLLRKRTGNCIPAICSYHGQYHATTPLRHIAGIVYNRYTVQHIKHTVLSAVTVAEFCKKFLVSHGVKPEKIQVIHNGIEEIDNCEIGKNELRSEWGVREEEVLIGVASRLDPVKGVEHVLQAFANLMDKYPQIKLVIIGTGMLDERLKTQASKLGLGERVIFAGARTDMGRCFSALDIFVLPSLSEYHSIALLEAMQAKRAIIATNVGGNTESVRDGVEALMVPAEDSEALTTAMIRLVSDRTFRKTLAEAAQTRFREEFTSERMQKETADWFLRCDALARSKSERRKYMG